MRSHIADAFAEWIGRSAHFNMVHLLLEAGWQCTQQPHKKGTGNMFDLSKNLFYLFMHKQIYRF